MQKLKYILQEAFYFQERTLQISSAVLLGTLWISYRKQQQLFSHNQKEKAHDWATTDSKKQHITSRFITKAPNDCAPGFRGKIYDRQIWLIYFLENIFEPA